MGCKYCIYRGCWGCKDNCNGWNDCPRFTLDWETLTDAQKARMLSILEDTEMVESQVSWNEEEVWEAIHELSDIRAVYSLFDEDESDKYHAYSLGIKALREVIKG